MPLPTDDLIVWASSDVNLPNLAGPNKVKPIDDLILKGWDFKQKPAADEFNYILNNMGKWINWAITDIEAGTSLSTPNTLVRRDGGGNFSAGTITAALTGNSSTATTLQNSRTINGTYFNGSTNITTNSWGAARTFALTGAVTGSVTIDGSGNISLGTSLSPTNGIAISTGMIAHGGTIPLPSGFSESQCHWFVSTNYIRDIGGDDLAEYHHCYTDGRLVYCYSDGSAGIFTGNANYIIIGIK